MAKQLMFDEAARTELRERPQAIGRRGQGHARADRPQRDSAEELGLAPDHQGRRVGQQGDRAARAVQEHGRQDGQRGRQQDLRRRRRRDHDLDRAGRGHLPGGPQARDRRRQPDGPQQGHRQGRRDRRASSSRTPACRSRATTTSPRSARSAPTTTPRSARFSPTPWTRSARKASSRSKKAKASRTS